MVRVSGSHHIYRKGRHQFSVPVHGSKDLGKGLVAAALKLITQAAQEDEGDG